MRRSALLFLFSVLILLLPGGVLAHTVTIDDPFSIAGIGPDFAVEYTHEDQDAWKGYVNLSMTNTGSDPWGDFHFTLFQVDAYDIANVIFTGTQSSSQADGLIGSDGHSVDFCFYSDPVQSGQTATFSLYTDNTTDKVPFFGLSFYPTPVPVPAAAWLLGSGLLALAGLRRRA